MTQLSDPISSIYPENLEYDPTDPKKRVEYFYQMYQNVGALVEIPNPMKEMEKGKQVPPDEYWLQMTAVQAHTTLMTAIAALNDLLSDKLTEGDDEDA